MTSNEFENVSAGLKRIAPFISGWGHIQNNGYDDLIKMYDYNTLEELESALSPFSEHIKGYWKRRWFLWKLSECDEHLFCEIPGVVHNPNRYDKSWDIDIRGTIRFDVKGTRVPYELRGSMPDLMDDPTPMVQFFYQNQSRERRFGMQNRLFVVHHSMVSGNQNTENILRCEWDVKRLAYRDFCDNLSRVKIIPFQGLKAAVIFILEKDKNKIEYLIP